MTTRQGGGALAKRRRGVTSLLMRAEHGHATEARDFALEGGCILCGGDLQVRVTTGGARTVCVSCRWISRPHMRKTEDGVHVVHPAGLIG